MGFELSLSLLLLLLFCVSVTAYFPSVKVTELPNDDDDDSEYSQLYSTVVNSSADGHSYASYQGSIRCKSTYSPMKPQSLIELQDMVYYALMRNIHIKAVGNLHSTTDIICTDALLIDMAKINHFFFDPETNLATIGAGAELQDVLEKLNERGRALTSTPAFGGITIGGALGTGAHGTTLKQPATISDQVVFITFIDGMGNLRMISAEDDDFKALKVNLGLLGIIFEVIVETTEQYKLEVKNFPVSDEILWTSQEIINIAKNNDVFQFWWFPTNKQIVMSLGNIVPVNASGNCESHFVSEFNAINGQGVLLSLELMQAAADDVGFFFVQSYSKMSLITEVPGRTPMFTEADGYTSCLPSAVGYSHRMMINTCKECFWNQGESSFLVEDASIAIPLSELPAALKTLRDIFDIQLTGFPLTGIWVRFLKRSDSYLGVNSRTDMAVIEWNTAPRHNKSKPKLGITAYQAIGQALIERHDGRPHWGKNALYYSNPKIIQRNGPDLQNFIDVMNKMDPYEIFMNDFGRRLKNGSQKTNVAKEATLRCALNEVCLCKEDSDCGNEGQLDFVCDEFMEFRVCKKRANPLDDIKDIVSRNVIRLAAGLSNNIDYIMDALDEYRDLGTKTN